MGQSKVEAGAPKPERGSRGKAAKPGKKPNAVLHVAEVYCPNIKCGDKIPFEATLCHGCGHQDVGYPNVRYANDPAEVAALDARLAGARARAEGDGSRARLDEFGSQAGASNAVTVMSLFDLRYLLTKKKNRLWTSYYRQKDGAGRISEHNKWDFNRGSVDEKISPQYYVHLNFAVLSLGDYGSGWYGGCHIKLDNDRIESRSSVFWENPFVFLKANHLPPDELVPPGYRASWARRGDLAVAKLCDKITPDIAEDAFADILLEADQAKEDADFIEVHIYEPVAPTAFVALSTDISLLDDDDLLDWKVIKRQFKDSNIPLRDGPDA